MIVRHPRSVRLPEIVGVSPLNPRHQIDDGDLDGLCASILANGLIEDILVEKDDGGTIGCDNGAGFYCLDGSRRWRALLRLAADGRIQPDAEIRVVEIVATEADKREIALAANFHRLGLHPVEQYEAFAGMARYRTEAEIAAHFRLDAKDVRKALALGRLAPEIRSAWKAGEMSAEAAQAFAGERDQARQLEIFTSLSAENRNDPAQVRRLLRGDAVVACHSTAIFARDEYLAAGGAIDEALFEDQAFFVNGPLLRACAEKKLAGIAERIRKAQGWKWAATEFNDDDAYSHSTFWADYSEADQARLDEIAAIDLGGCDDATRAALLREAEEIELRAWTRGVSAADRARLGIVLSLDQDGAITIDGGLLRAEDRSPAEPGEATATGDRAKPQDEDLRRSPEPVAKADKQNKALRALMDTAVSRALGDCALRNLNVALAIFVASFHSSGRDLLAMYGGGANSMAAMRRTPHDLLDEIAGMDFDAALGCCLGAPLADLTTAFSATIARAIDASGMNADAMGRVVAAIGAISAIGPALDAALDREAYFDAAPKQVSLDAIRECLGETAAHDAAKLSRDKIADEAARVTADRQWLPAPWSAWIADLPGAWIEGQRSYARLDGMVTLAEAMQAAIADDEGAKAKPRHDAPRTARVQAQSDCVERFLQERTRKADGQRIRAADFHAAFIDWAVEQEIDDVPALGAFGNIVKNLGLPRYRTKDGTFYTNRALKAKAAPARRGHCADDAEAAA